MKRFPFVLMRGGTSKAPFFLASDMPADRALWCDFLLDVMGSPDARQIDGLGGGNSLTSKVAIIAPSERPDADVEYTFAQVSLTARTVDLKGNCGNISSAVGPYAIAQGLVPATEPVTRVRVFNTNTQKLIACDVPVKNGQVCEEGTAEILGVPGTSAPIWLSFVEPAGAVTGKLLPTGNVSDRIMTATGPIHISIVDAGNPLVFVNAADVGLSGKELPGDFTPEKLEELEAIRSIAAELCGFAAREKATELSPAVPKMTIVAPAAPYLSTQGKMEEDADILIRMMSMQKPHQALAITGAVCTAVAAGIDGTIPAQLITIADNELLLGHPAGTMPAAFEKVGDEIVSVRVLRTARRLAEGFVYTHQSYAVAGCDATVTSQPAMECSHA